MGLAIIYDAVLQDLFIYSFPILLAFLMIAFISIKETCQKCHKMYKKDLAIRKKKTFATEILPRP